MSYDIIAATSVLAVKDQHIAAISDENEKGVTSHDRKHGAHQQSYVQELHAAAYNGQRAAAQRGNKIEEMLKKKEEEIKARKFIGVPERSRKAKVSITAKARTIQKKLPFTGPSPVPRNREHEDADDEEMIIKAEPLPDTRSFHQINPSTTTTIPATHSRTARTTPAAPNTTPSTSSPHQPTQALTTTTPQNKDKRRMSLMLELKRIEVEKKRVELRELEMQLRIMETEVEEY